MPGLKDRTYRRKGKWGAGDSGNDWSLTPPAGLNQVWQVRVATGVTGGAVNVTLKMVDLEDNEWPVTGWNPKSIAASTVEEVSFESWNPTILVDVTEDTATLVDTTGEVHVLVTSLRRYGYTDSGDAWDEVDVAADPTTTTGWE